MIPKSCLLIETSKFPILAGEKDEIVNENMYGKALCQYLETQLPLAGVKVPFYCNEDWGWWLETELNGFKMAMRIYSDPDANPNPERYALLPSIKDAKKWSWSKLQSVDMSQDVLKVIDAVESIFRRDSDIRIVTRHDDYPF